MILNEPAGMLSKIIVRLTVKGVVEAYAAHHLLREHCADEPGTAGTVRPSILSKRCRRLSRLSVCHALDRVELTLTSASLDHPYFVDGSSQVQREMGQCERASVSCEYLR